MMQQLFVVINYVVLGLALMYFTFVSMRDVYEPKHGLAPGLAYYAFKFLIDFLFYSMMPNMSDGLRLLGFAWGLLAICLTFPVCVLLFWGSTPGLYCSITAINAILSAAQLISFYVANLLLNKPLGTPFQESYGLGTLMSIAILTVEFLCLRKPLAWMAGGIQRFPHRYQVPLAELTFLATAGFIYSVYQPVPYASAVGATVTYWEVILFSIVPSLAIAVIQFSLSRRARTQTQYLRQVEELTLSYRERIRAQLAIAERDRALFDGLDTSLERLGQQDGSSELLERIARLEDAYERITGGTYCENPVYDAFLCAEASRLEALGVRPCFSVAALSLQTELSPQLLLQLLAGVDRLAARAKKAEGSEVNLRIRSLNDMLYVTLDLPSSWGRLRARQLLEDAGLIDDLLVSERVTDGRTEVHVFNQKEGSCLSS